MAKLGDVFPLVRNGVSIRQTDGATGIPITRIETISNREIDRNKFGYANIIDGSKYKNYILQDGDILMSHINSEKHLGKVALYRKQGNEQIIHGMNLLMLRANSSVLFPPYATYFFETPAFLMQIQKITKKSVNQASFTVTALKEIEIPLPPLDEQCRIAAVLDKVGGLIAKRREQLDKLDELVKARFVEMFGDPINNTKGLPTTPLGEICYLKAGVTTASDEIHSQSKEYSVPCYGGNGIRGYVKEATQRGTYPIIGRQGALCGNVQLAIGEFHATEHAVLVSPIIKTNVIWVYYLLKFMDLYRYHTGAAQPGLAVKTLNMVEIPCADIGLQNEFATFAEQVEKSKLTIQQSLDKLEVLKKALKQQYFG